MSTTKTTWILELLDKVTAPLRSVQQSMERTQKTYNSTQKSVTSTSGIIEGLNNRLQWLEQRKEKAFTPEHIQRYNVLIKKTQSELDKLNSLPSEGFFSRLRRGDGLFATLLRQASRFVGVMAIMGATSSMINISAQAEQTAVAFEVMLGSAEKGSKMYNSLLELGNIAPYATSKLNDAAKTMLGFGVASDQVLPYLKSIGDIAMGDANRLDSLTLAFSQMMSTGKLMGQDLLQMINAGFNPLEEISRKTGKSIGTLKDEMGKGTISSKMVADAFVSATGAGGRFAGMMDRMSNTFSGKVSTFNAKVQLFAMNLGNVFLPVLTRGMEVVIPWVEVLSRNTDTLLTLGKAVLVVVAAQKAYNIHKRIALVLDTQYSGSLRKVIAALLSTERAQKLLNLTMLKNPYLWVIGGVMLLTNALKKVYDNATRTQKAINSVMKSAVDYAAEERMQLDSLFNKLRQTNPKSKERNALIKQLKEMYPEYLKNMDVEKRLVSDMGGLYNDLAAAIDKSARRAAVQDFVREQYKKALELQVQFAQNAQERNRILQEGTKGKTTGVYFGFSKFGRALTETSNYNAQIRDINSLIQSVYRNVLGENFGGLNIPGSGTLQGSSTPITNATDLSASGKDSTGSGGGGIKNITMNVDFKQYFEPKGTSDIRQIATEVVRMINDQLRDGIVQYG